MPCSLTLTGRAFPCNKGLGGIRRIWVKAFDPADFPQPSAGVIANSSQDVTFYGYDLAKNSGNLTQTINSSPENGTLFYDQALEAVLVSLVGADTAEFHAMLKTRLSILVEDNNGEYLLMGLDRGVEATGGSIATGTANGDLSGYTFNLSAQEALPCPHVTIGANITLTPMYA